MPNFRAVTSISITLNKDVILRAFKDETEEDAIARAKKRLVVPKKLDRGWKMTSVTYDDVYVEEDEDNGTWICSMEARLVAQGEQIFQEPDAEIALESAEHYAAAVGDEIAASVFLFLGDDGDMKGWTYDDGEVDILDILPWRRQAPEPETSSMAP